MSAYPPPASQGYAPPPESGACGSPYGAPGHPASYGGGSPACTSAVYAPPPGTGSGYSALRDEGARMRPANENKKIGCVIITALVLTIITAILLISATAGKWSRIEVEYDAVTDTGNLKLKLNLYLGKVKKDGDFEGETWDSYSDFKEDASVECKTMAKKFKTADDAARGTIALPYVAIFGMLGLIIFTMATQMKHLPINMALSIIATVSIGLVLIPSGSWADDVPSLDDVKHCFYDHTKLTYWPSYEGPILLFISAVVILITAILACVETSSAKTYYKQH
jgi:hypothetical protein